GALADPAEGLRDAARLAIALHRLWLTRGPLFEGIDYLERLRAAADAPDAPALDVLLRAQLLSGAAHLAGTRSLFSDAQALFARSLALYREAGDRPGTAATLANLGWQTWNMGDLDAGEALSREAIAIHESLGDSLGIALARNNLAWIATERGAFDEAARHFDAVIASHQARGDLRSVAFTMSWRGVLAARRGEVHQAVDLFERSIAAGDPVADIGYRTLVLVRLAAARHALGTSDEEPALVASAHLPALRGFGRLWPLAYALTELGSMRLDLGDVAGARTVLAEALEARRVSRGTGGMIETLTLSGIAAHRAGDLHGAARHLTEALPMARAYRAPPLAIACLEAVAPLAVAAGHPEHAVTLLHAADSALGALGARRTPRHAAQHAARRGALRDLMGARRFELACADDRAVSLDAAAPLAMDELHALLASGPAASA
ncbi:MAG: transcriptional activator domain protein, partial [Gemmatimonadetes bacterium]|nr:transcriptional activator domain protein [Gemmatimonadota bacterium]